MSDSLNMFLFDSESDIFFPSRLTVTGRIRNRILSLFNWLQIIRRYKQSFSFDTYSASMECLSNRFLYIPNVSLCSGLASLWSFILNYTCRFTYFKYFGFYFQCHNVVNLLLKLTYTVSIAVQAFKILTYIFFVMLTVISKIM